MSAGLTTIIEQFSGRSVLVIGDAILDVYLEGMPSSLCREAPVPVIAMTERRNVPGGAANTAVNIASLGGRAVFLSVIGDDDEGRLLRAALEERGVSTEFLVTAQRRRTLTKHRLIASSQMLLRYDQGNVDAIDEECALRLAARLRELYRSCDAVIVSDYNYGLFTPAVVNAVAMLQAEFPTVLVVDAKDPARFRHIDVTAVKPNYGEALRMLGLERVEGLNARVEQMAQRERELYERTGAQIVAVTLDTDGAIVFERSRSSYRTYARPAPNSKATGAGDTFVSTLTLSLAASASTPDAAELASAAASIVVAKEGTAVCSYEELRGGVSAGSKLVRDTASLAALGSFYRSRGRGIVFTNGCFDLLHRGHVTYLSRAKALGDVLFVGVNADNSVRRLKGQGRPITVLEDRLLMLAALSCVDHVIGFEEDTPVEIIKLLKPALYVKGGDYTRETLPEAPLVESMGGVVHLLPYLEDKSTSGIIERIRRSTQGRSAVEQPVPLVAK